MTPDARSLNRMDPNTKAVHFELERWGKWAREYSSAWPETTLLARIIKQGAQGAGQSGRPPISMPERIQRIDAAVARLNSPSRQIIVTYYTRWQPAEVMARQHNLSVRQFQSILRMARMILIPAVCDHDHA